VTILIWIGFLVFIAAMVLLDLGVFHRQERVISIREALGWTSAWVAMALLFNVFIYFLYDRNWLGWTDLSDHAISGKDAAMQFLVGYLIEKSLSVDNIFVIAMVFAFFKVPAKMQHRVLFWGILGAVILRGIMIAIGSALLDRFDWMMYVFGAVLIYSAIKMMLAKEDDFHPDRNLFVRAARKLFKVSSEYHGHHFFVRIDGELTATPLFLSLILVESCDVMFAVDSIPAIFAITRDPFLVFTSNIFAILGLRSLFFAVAGLMEMFQYLKTSLVFLLLFIGIKMMVPKDYPWHPGHETSLIIIVGILGAGVIASILANYFKTPVDAEPGDSAETPPSTMSSEEASTKADQHSEPDRSTASEKHS
jgi:tellurite resistance protein TerC